MFSISNKRLSAICNSPAHSCFDKDFVVYLRGFFIVCCEPEQRDTNLRYDSSHKTSEIKEHKQAEQQQSSVFSSSTTSPNVSKMFAQQNKQQYSTLTKRNTRTWWEWAARWWSRAISQCVSAVRSTFHESCWVLFPLTYNLNGLGPAERSEVGRFKHNKHLKTDSHRRALSNTFWICLHHLVYLFRQSGHDVIATSLINLFFFYWAQRQKRTLRVVY